MSGLIEMPARPLRGWRILNTRAAHQAWALSGPLRQLGAQVIEIPTIEITSAGSLGPLDNALFKIDHYDVLILTSVNGVEVLFDRYNKLGLPMVAMQHLLVVAIGPATARAIQSEGLGVSLVPEKYIAESVVEALRGKIHQDSRVLLVRAKIARDLLPNQLRQMGAKVEVVEAYQTRVPEGAAAKIKELFKDSRNRPHIVTFTSSSTVTNFLSALGSRDQQRELLADVLLASIGPVTSATLRSAGFDPALEADDYAIDGLITAIRDFVGGRGRTLSPESGR
jgi:uroporphyrinogen-III synthase